MVYDQQGQTNTALQKDKKEQAETYLSKLRSSIEALFSAFSDFIEDFLHLLVGRKKMRRETLVCSRVTRDGSPMVE